MKNVAATLGFWVILASLAFVGLYTLAGGPQWGKLGGKFVEVKVDTLTFDSWIHEKYQSSFDAWYKHKFAPRPPFVRLHNQLVYSLNRKSPTAVMVGQNDQYYAYDYFSFFRGFNVQSREHWKGVGQSLAEFRDTLATHGIPVLVVIAPNKARVFNDNLPLDKVNIGADTTEWVRFIEVLRREKLDYIDVNEWFLAMRDTASYPLFPNTGTHWTGYGALLFSDSMLHRMEYMLDTPVVDMNLAKGQWYSDSIIGDDELGELMNVIYPPKTQDLYYPSVSYNREGRLAPNVLMIADSYFWTINKMKVNHNAFSPLHSFWYYTNTNYDSIHGIVDVDELNVWDELLDRDFVVVMFTESNLNLAPFRIDELFLKEE